MTCFWCLDHPEPLKSYLTGHPPPKVAVLREEGSNSDREMAAVLHMAGFEAWDVNMEDLCTERINLDQFRGLVFVGGFSYADVCGSAKGLFQKILQCVLIVLILTCICKYKIVHLFKPLSKNIIISNTITWTTIFSAFLSQVSYQ